MKDHTEAAAWAHVVTWSVCHSTHCCHVPADVREICHELDLKDSIAASGADLVTGFHHVVWMGDLNYRLDYGEQVCVRL